MKGIPGVTVAVVLLLTLVLSLPARAQLAQSFYNITGIQTKTLPNAVQVTIQTDGNVTAGLDIQEVLNLVSQGTNSFSIATRTVRSFRIRFVGAKAKVPAFTDIGTYPVDAAAVTLSREPFKFPYFVQGSDPFQNGALVSATLSIDVEIRFYVPITVTSFNLQAGADYGFDLGGGQQPLNTSIKVSPDQRAVIVTVITDRVDTARYATRMRRSPPEQQKHRLSVNGSGTPADPLRVEALHAPLNQVVGEVSRAAGVPIAARPDAADVDVSLVLPAATLGAALQALSQGLGLALTARPEEEGGGFAIGKGGTPLLNERIPLRHLAPEDARLLFPDFLLPYLHTDTEHNALLVSGTPALLVRLRQDLTRLDLPRPQVRVEARVFEVSQPEDSVYALSGLFASGKEAFDTDAGTVSILLQPGQQQTYSARLQALIARGRARLAARPFVVVASGEKGTLFLGQTRLLPVLQNAYGGQTSILLSIPIGTTLTVTPTASSAADGEILLNLSPRFTTVDAIEKGTGLPTVGIREVNCVVRVHPGDTILIAGLQSQSDERVDNRFAPLARIPLLGWLFASHRTAKTRVTLIVSVTARLVGSDAASSAVAPDASPAKKGT